MSIKVRFSAPKSIFSKRMAGALYSLMAGISINSSKKMLWKKWIRNYQKNNKEICQEPQPSTGAVQLVPSLILLMSTFANAAKLQLPQPQQSKKSFTMKSRQLI